MFEKVNILAQETLTHPIHVRPGDTVVLSYRSYAQLEDNLVVSINVTKAGVYTKGVIFEGEFEGKCALGAMLLD